MADLRLCGVQCDVPSRSHTFKHDISTLWKEVNVYYQLDNCIHRAVTIFEDLWSSNKVCLQQGLGQVDSFRVNRQSSKFRMDWCHDDMALKHWYIIIVIFGWIKYLSQLSYRN